ncbi:condensation domain-containing protein, partial [Streptomyces afghaniensis]|uniref:condensation domain-containing protein n=1 Tax=Streptomyces afghaniensis TaxID=66865 RepID=UPI000560A229
VQLPLRALFETPVLEPLAAVLRSAKRVGALPELRPVRREGPLPLSFAQQRMWFLHQLEPDSSLYNVPAAVRLSGPMDVERLREALLTVAGRHETLRTRFEEHTSGPVQIVGDKPMIDITAQDLSHT